MKNFDVLLLAGEFIRGYQGKEVLSFPFNNFVRSPIVELRSLGKRRGSRVPRLQLILLVATALCCRAL